MPRTVVGLRSPLPNSLGRRRAHSPGEGLYGANETSQGAALAPGPIATELKRPGLKAQSAFSGLLTALLYLCALHPSYSFKQSKMGIHKS